MQTLLLLLLLRHQLPTYKPTSCRYPTSHFISTTHTHHPLYTTFSHTHSSKRSSDRHSSYHGTSD
jgi:hypothetical protein